MHPIRRELCDATIIFMFATGPFIYKIFTTYFLYSKKKLLVRKCVDAAKMKVFLCISIFIVVAAGKLRLCMITSKLKYRASANMSIKIGNPESTCSLKKLVHIFAADWFGCLTMYLLGS